MTNGLWLLRDRRVCLKGSRTLRSVIGLLVPDLLCLASIEYRTTLIAGKTVNVTRTQLSVRVSRLFVVPQHGRFMTATALHPLQQNSQVHRIAPSYLSSGSPSHQYHEGEPIGKASFNKLLCFWKCLERGSQLFAMLRNASACSTGPNGLAVEKLRLTTQRYDLSQFRKMFSQITSKFVYSAFESILVHCLCNCVVSRV